MDRISFTGINNIKIYKKTYEQFGSYLPANYAYKKGEIQDVMSYGKKKYNEIIINCDLTDDTFGADLTMFREALKNSQLQYEFNCVDKSNPNYISLFLKRFDVRDEIGHTSNSEFKINGCPILLNDRGVLPIYSFIARLTRKISEMQELSEPQRKCANFVNKSVHKEAVEFIENM